MNFSFPCQSNILGKSFYEYIISLVVFNIYYITEFAETKIAISGYPSEIFLKADAPVYQVSKYSAFIKCTHRP